MGLTRNLIKPKKKDKKLSSTVPTKKPGVTPLTGTINRRSKDGDNPLGADKVNAGKRRLRNFTD